MSSCFVAAGSCRDVVQGEGFKGGRVAWTPVGFVGGGAAISGETTAVKRSFRLGGAAGDEERDDSVLAGC